MNLTYHHYKSLPKLAWCAVIERGVSQVDVYHGSSVEVSETFFVEGAWTGRFSEGKFDQSIFLAGSGGRLVYNQNGSDKAITFATPSHVLDRLFSIVIMNTFYISNSLPFILSMSGSNLDLHHLNYENELNSILKGLDSYVREIPLKDARELRIHYYSNITIDRGLNLSEDRKAAITSFDNFECYYKAMLETLQKLVENSQSTKRKIRYGLLTTISRGYDAAACAAVARELGCDQCVTFNQPEKYALDGGKEIAQILGYDNIVEKNAEQYLHNDHFAEAEFVSSGELGSGIIFSAFEKEFASNLVFVGIRGDKIWAKNNYETNKDFRFEKEIYPGTSWSENRLRVGYILLPLPLFGASEWPSIARISNSKEMLQFSVGGDYDRPIPRRIVESKGVPRDLFGARKIGAGFNYRWDNSRRIKKRMSPRSYVSFQKFVKQNKRKFRVVLLPYVRFLWASKSQYLSYVLGKIGMTYKARAADANSLSNPGAPSYLFPWGVCKTMLRYQLRGVSSAHRVLGD